MAPVRMIIPSLFVLVSCNFNQQDKSILITRTPRHSSIKYDSSTYATISLIPAPEGFKRINTS